MKKKSLEQIEWMSTKSKKKKKSVKKNAIAVANVFDFQGENYLVVDITLDSVPQVRICIGKSDYGNYFPAGSQMEKGPRWNGKNVDNLNLYSRLKQIKGGVTIDIDSESQEVISNFNREYGKYPYTAPWEILLQRMEQTIVSAKTDAAEHRRCERINSRMKTVPAIPRGFKTWAKNMLNVHNMSILPYRKKPETIGICSNCGEKTIFKKGEASPGDLVKCPACKKEAVVKRIDWEKMNPLPVKECSMEVILFQKTEEGFVERHFVSWKDISVNSEKSGVYEKARLFIVHGTRYRYFAKSDWLGGVFWDDRNIYGMNNITICSGPIYPKTISDEMFDGTDYKYSAMNLLMNEPGFEPTAYLEKYLGMPQLEMMVKVGLKKLALQITKYDFVEGKKPWEILGLEKKQFNRMRALNGGRAELRWMEYEHQKNRNIEDDVIRYFTSNGICPDDVSFIADRMTEQKISNYLMKQCKGIKRTPQEMLGTWQDYLSMAKRLKMDTSVELIFKPKDLVKSHNEAVQLCGGQEIAKRASEISEQFPNIDDICKEIKPKYEWKDENYAIVVPDRIEDIIHEGRVLGHCLDRSDIYFDRIQRRESFIVFLRKTENIEQPFYTMEIEPGGSARQKRTTGDKQNKDFNEAKVFIGKWQREIQKRLTREDRELAKISAVMRVEEFKELRETKAKIRSGYLIGKLLADVLEADLMEVAVC